MAYAASACRLIKKVEIKSERINTTKTMKIETLYSCKKKLIVETIAANRKWEQIR